MTIKTQKIISAALIAIVTVGGFEALFYILNLNQTSVFVHTAFWIYAYLALKMAILFDLHFKSPGSWQRAKKRHEAAGRYAKRYAKIFFSAVGERLEHFRHWKYFRLWVHFLFVPAVIYWSTIALFFVNLGHFKTQQIFALLSSAALILNYWHVKEVFYRRREKVDSETFVALTTTKIYATAAAFSAALALTRYYCLPAKYFVIAIFCLSFLFVYQALYQHRLTGAKIMVITFFIAVVMSQIGHVVLLLWSFNYFTAGVFLSVCYNLFWAVFHYYLDSALTIRAFLEIFVFSIVIAAMVLSATNFRARILDSCNYSVSPSS